MIPITSYRPPSYYECTPGTGSMGQCTPPPRPVLTPWGAAPLAWPWEKVGKQVFASYTPKRLSPRSSRKWESPPQKDEGVLQLQVGEGEGAGLLPEGLPGRDMAPSLPCPGGEDTFT